MGNFIVISWILFFALIDYKQLKVKIGRNISFNTWQHSGLGRMILGIYHFYDVKILGAAGIL